MVRYLKIGNQTATIIALCNMVDYDLKKEHVQLAVLDAGGLEVNYRFPKRSNRKDIKGTKHLHSCKLINFYLYEQVLSNLLETEDVKCRTGSLRIIKQITVHPEIRRSVTLMGGVEVT